MSNYTDKTVESFLSNVKQLEQKAAGEDLRRSQQLKSDLSSMSYKGSDIILPRPRARTDKFEMPNSKSMKNFNSMVSREYRVDLDELVYESAYNYDKFSKSNSLQNAPKPYSGSTFIPEPSDSIVSSSYKPKKRDDMPEIIKFDDFATRRPYKPAQSRYSKFEISDEKRQEIDETLNSLMKKSLILDAKENDDDIMVHPLTKTQKGGRMNNEWATEAKSKPKLAPPVKIKPSYLQQSTNTSETVSNDLNNLKKSPRKFDLHDASYSHNLKKSPLKNDISEFSTNSKPRPTIKPKPESLKTIFNDSKPASFMASVIRHTNSTNQSLLTDSKIKVNPLTKTGTSWMDSAKKNTPISHTDIQSKEKIKILSSSSNNFAKNQSKSEQSDRKRTETLNELSYQKLQHTSNNRAKSPNVEFPSLSLKKTRPTVPSKPGQLSNSDPEFLQKKLSSIKKTEKNVSDLPEALKKSKSLKPPVPKRKPSLKITEAFAVKQSLKQRISSTKKPQEEKPEGLIQLNNLKASKPIRKASVKELEALESLKKIKAKGSAPPIKPKNERVVSQSKELLQSQLSHLKSVNTLKQESETSPLTAGDQYKKNLQQLLLRKVQTTDTSLGSSAKSAFSEGIKPVKKAATFDAASSIDTGKLDHINAKRSRGPKRRAPKAVK